MPRCQRGCRGFESHHLLSQQKGIALTSVETVLYRDIEGQLSEDTKAAVRHLRIITHYGDNITAGTICDALSDADEKKPAGEVSDAAFLYDSQFAVV